MNRAVKKRDHATLEATRREKKAQRDTWKDRYKQLGKNIKALRKMHGEKQEQLGAAIGVRFRSFSLVLLATAPGSLPPCPTPRNTFIVHHLLCACRV